MNLDFFLIERGMGLFWVLVQQCCFVCIKYAHDDIARGDGKAARLAASQVAAAALLAAFCFAREAGLPGAAAYLVRDGGDYYPWSVRIALCGAMILFDSLLVLYFYRIVRIYRNGLAARRPTLPGDCAVLLSVAALCVWYVAASVGAAGRLGLDMWQYTWIGRFFIQISNFFYIALEVGGAVLFWRFYAKLRQEASPDVG